MIIYKEPDSQVRLFRFVRFPQFYNDSCLDICFTKGLIKLFMCYILYIKHINSKVERRG